MGLLPDFDENGRLLKNAPPLNIVKSGRWKRIARTIDWINLLETRCPSCGSKLTLTSSLYSCGDNACAFSIAEFKFIKIVRSLKERQEFEPQRFDF